MTVGDRTGAPAVALAALLAGTACGPSLLWSGHTADRRHRLEVVADDGAHWVVVDGVRRSSFSAVATSTIAVADDGDHLAYAAQVDGGWRVVRDRRPGPRWDGVGELALGRGGRLAYAAERDGRWYVVDGERPGPGFDAVLAGTLRFSADGRRLAYVARDRHGDRAVVDGAIGPAFDGVGQLTVADDGAAVAYVGRRGQQRHVVVGAGRGGALGPPVERVAQLTASPRGGRIAYAARTADGWRVVERDRNGRERGGPAVERVDRIAFSPDGRHLVYVARVGGLGWLVLDGELAASAPALRTAPLAFAAGPGAGLVHVAPDPGGGERLVRGGVAGRRYDAIAGVVVSPDRRRVGYAARAGSLWRIVIDDDEEPPARWVSAPVFGPDGRRVAYLARYDRGVDVVVDRRRRRFDLVLDGTLAFSRDGRRWAAIVGDLARERLYFAVDGVVGAPIALAEIYSAAARLAAAGPLADPAAGDELLRRWTEAEADRTAR